MVAKPHGDDCVVVVGCPPTTAYGGSHGREASTAQEEGSSCGRRTVLAWIFAAVAITAFVLLAVFLSRKFPDGQPRYSVAVVAVAGLDPARDLSARGRLTISPVFNVTVHVDNTRSAVNEACVEELATAVVSYGDAFLGRGTVPAFCAPRRREAEAAQGVGAGGRGAVVPAGRARRRAGGGGGDGGRQAGGALGDRLQGQGRRGTFSVRCVTSSRPGANMMTGSTDLLASRSR